MYKKPLSKKQRKIFNALALSRKILLVLAEEAADGLNEMKYSNIFNPFFYWKRNWTREDEEYAEAAQMKRALLNLRARKCVEIRKQGDKLLYVLTDKGTLAGLKDQIRLAGKRNDGKILLVSFDIPEQEHVARARLRYVLKDCGFERIQHSLWGSVMDVEKQVFALVKEMDAGKWIRIFISKEIGA